jgi:chloramphenicol 3-O phosphotransferase
MAQPAELGQIIILNGAPRSGKSSIVSVIQETFEGPWMNLGVDTFGAATPARYRPGIGLRPRPGGERPGLEPFVALACAALYDSVAAHSRLGLNVVVDIGHHDAYSRPLGTLADAARRLKGLPVLFVGVRCSIDEIMRRRNAGQAGRDGMYAVGTEAEPVPRAVERWQDFVHVPGVYDMEVDTTATAPEACVAAIQNRLTLGPAGSAFSRLAGGA